MLDITNLGLREILDVEDVENYHSCRVVLPNGAEPLHITLVQAAMLSNLERGGPRAFVHFIEANFFCGTPKELYAYDVILPKEPGEAPKYVVRPTDLARQARYDLLEYSGGH